MWDWGKGEGYSHLQIEVGWDGSGDKINQHTYDRYHYPWNWGYQNEHDSRIRQKMRAVVIHVNT
jgi:hypothetical protein